MLRARGTINVTLCVVFIVCFELAFGFPTRHHKSPNARFTNNVSPEASTHSASSEVNYGHSLEENQVQSLLGNLHQHRRWSLHHSPRVLPPPTPEEEAKPFILDLKNFPDLASADTGSQNPNIQVTIEVVDEPQMEVAMDLVEEQGSNWSTSSSSSVAGWLEGKKLFWPLFWGYTDAELGEDAMGQAIKEEEEEEEDYTSEYDSGEPLPSGEGEMGSKWDKQRYLDWDPIHSYYEQEQEEWSAWTPCMVTCGHGNQTRTRSCGDFCISTESRSCDLDPCPEDLNPISSVFPFAMENGTEPFGTDVDSCEKWLNCKSEFLQRYLHQVLTELPSCPCSYPSTAALDAVSLPDKRRGRTFRWRDASDPRERLDVYKPTARSCLRSILSVEGATLAAQHCCYDNQGLLLTRGKGAGTPDLISEEFSPELHFRVDVLPWILCKGDWSRLHAARPPNNGLGCPDNPQHDAFMTERQEAQEY